MKNLRQEKILEIIESMDIETQDELTAELERLGFKVTQATVSRDIRALKLTKVSSDRSRQKYVQIKPHQSANISEKYLRVLCDGFVSVDMAQNILVIKTVSGMAMAVAAALDSMHFEGIVGTIAGDDTIMCAVRTVENTEALVEELNKLVADYHKGS